MDNQMPDFACFLAGNTYLNKMIKLQQVLYLIKVMGEFTQRHQEVFEKSDPNMMLGSLMEETSMEELNKVLTECKFYSNFKE